MAVLLIREVPLHTTVGTEPAIETAAPDTRDRLISVLVPEPNAALRALDDLEQAQEDLRVTRARLDASVTRLREIGLTDRQLGRLLDART